MTNWGYSKKKQQAYPKTTKKKSLSKIIGNTKPSSGKKHLAVVSKHYDSEGNEIPNKRFYIITKDSAMSGWGRAKDKDNIIILTADTIKEAEIVEDNLKERGEEFKEIRITGTLPHFSYSNNYVQYKSEDDWKNFYIEDYWRKRNEQDEKKNEGYNGWKNRDTWAVPLVWDNDQNLYDQKNSWLRTYAETIKKGNYSLKPVHTFIKNVIVPEAMKQESVNPNDVDLNEVTGWLIDDLIGMDYISKEQHKKLKKQLQ